MTDQIELSTTTGEPDENGTAQPPSSPAPAPPPDYIEVNGRRLSTNDLEPYVRVMDWANSNPGGWDELVKWEKGEKVLVEKQKEQTPTRDNDEWVDPVLKVALDRIDQLDRHITEREEVERKSAIDSGVHAFLKANGDLTAEEKDAVLSTVKDHRLIDIYLSRAPHDQTGAVRQALETGLRIALPDRERVRAAAELVTNVNDRKRASAASGSTAPISREPAAPTTKEERLAAMAAELKDAMHGA